MDAKHEQITYRGRSLGIAILTVAQLLIGVIHILSGATLLAVDLAYMLNTVAYNVYTLVFGLLTLVFAVFLWQGKKAGWIGTVVVSVFVTAADILTLLDLPSIPGITKLPAYTEIAYNFLVIFYLLQTGVRKKYLLKAST